MDHIYWATLNSIKSEFPVPFLFESAILTMKLPRAPVGTGRGKIQSLIEKELSISRHTHLLFKLPYKVIRWKWSFIQSFRGK